MNRDLIINLTYILSTFLFIMGLKLLGRAHSARKGNIISAVGMTLAVLATFLDPTIMNFKWIALGIGLGSIVGYISAKKVAMTSMPEMVALLNGLGGLSSLLLGWGAISLSPLQADFTYHTIIFSVVIGGITFTGSVLAFAKLKELISGKPISFPGMKLFNLALVIGIMVASGMYFINPVTTEPAIGLEPYFMGVVALSFIFGITSVLPIGGADMPVVISLLNSLSGIAACAAGFAVQNNLLIVAGTLVGASGIILTNIMCKAMNRKLSSVLLGGFGAGGGKAQKVEGEVKPVSVEDAFLMLEAARSVCIVPGYGLAVAQAQHAVRELGELLENEGVEIRYAIHPVAGRMPGHMNVLLAEASVPYEQLVEMDAINPIMSTVDVCIVIGANDVVNPAAREDQNSPIYGMPIINVDQAKTVIVLKRSMASGFAGIENPLFYRPNTRMLFGDAKASVQGLVAEFKNI